MLMKEPQGRRTKKVILIIFYLHTRSHISSTALAGYWKNLWPEMLHRSGWDGTAVLRKGRNVSMDNCRKLSSMKEGSHQHSWPWETSGSLWKQLFPFYRRKKLNWKWLSHIKRKKNDLPTTEWWLSSATSEIKSFQNKYKILGKSKIICCFVIVDNTPCELFPVLSVGLWKGFMDGLLSCHCSDSAAAICLKFNFIFIQMVNNGLKLHIHI